MALIDNYRNAEGFTVKNPEEMMTPEKSIEYSKHLKKMMLEYFPDSVYQLGYSFRTILVEDGKFIRDITSEKEKKPKEKRKLTL